MDTIRCAVSSAIIYSLVETAKANNIKVYDYLELLLTELPKHANDTSRDFIQYLLPWSDFVREKCGREKNHNVTVNVQIYRKSLKSAVSLCGTHD